MFLGRVTGEVWATRRVAALGSERLLVVVPLVSDVREIASRNVVIVADRIGAGVGEQVVVAFGHAARNALGVGEDAAIEAAVVGIVDESAVRDDGSRP